MNAEFRKLVAAIRDDKVESAPIRESVSTLQTAVSLFPLKNIFLSFNGGKDATISLHLTAAVLAANDLLPAAPERFPIRCVYFEESDPFPQVEEFISEMEDLYRLDIVRFPPSVGMKAGLKSLVDENGAKAFILGVRRVDPHGRSVHAFSPSSAGWPTFLRIHPILDWSYRDVWLFLRGDSGDAFPYCTMYDAGYTSIGGISNSAPHPALRKDDGTHKPAYELTDDDSERIGREVAAAGATAKQEEKEKVVVEEETKENGDSSNDEDLERKQEKEKEEENDKEEEDQQHGPVDSTPRSKRRAAIFVEDDAVLAGCASFDIASLIADHLRQQHGTFVAQVSIVSEREEMHVVEGQLKMMVDNFDMVVVAARGCRILPAVSAALSLPLAHCPCMAAALKRREGGGVGGAGGGDPKLALLPAGSKLCCGMVAALPLVKCKNVYMLLGEREELPMALTIWMSAQW